MADDRDDDENEQDEDEDEDGPLQGSDELIEALVKVHDLETELFAWSHLEEHWFEHEELDTLAKKLHKAGATARDRRRSVLDRIFAIGGTIEGTVDEPIPALKGVLRRLEAIHAACQAAYEASENPDDYVTQQLLQDNQECLESQISKLKAKLRYYASIGDQLTQSEME